MTQGLHGPILCTQMLLFNVLAGQKELKVFVDLAMMSAGDEPMNIKKVQCLHSAVIGYAPLIFDLKTNCDFKQLLEMFKIVFKEFEANPKLPNQLVLKLFVLLVHNKIVLESQTCLE